MRDGFVLAGLMPTYREGPLALAAARSLVEATDMTVVFEGPAGDVSCEGAPDTGVDDGCVDYFRLGRWESDAAKRTEMLRLALKRYPARPLWGMWLDADEILVNGRYARDLVQERVWHDQEHPDEPATGGIPLRLVEYDGTCSFARGRLIRLDTLRRFVVSNLIVETVDGVQMRIGNVSESDELYRAAREHFPEAHIVPPPLPGEPVIVHRSHLRHPARRSLRLHEQERSELERLGLPV